MIFQCKPAYTETLAFGLLMVRSEGTWYSFRMVYGTLHWLSEPVALDSLLFLKGEEGGNSVIPVTICMCYWIKFKCYLYMRSNTMRNAQCTQMHENYFTSLAVDESMNFGIEKIIYEKNCSLEKSQWLTRTRNLNKVSHVVDFNISTDFLSAMLQPIDDQSLHFWGRSNKFQDFLSSSY